MTYQPKLFEAPARRRPPVRHRSRPKATAGGPRRPDPAAVDDPGWRLDERTRRAGRRGLAAARAALARATGDQRGTVGGSRAA